MLNLLFQRVQSHPVWAVGFAIFTASVVFFAGEYNTTEENALALRKDFNAIKEKRGELSDAFELMRQQQAFFSYYRNREEEYKESNVHALPRSQRDEKISGFLDEYAQMRTNVGEAISELRATTFDHPRLNHAKDLFLGDLLVADELLQARIGTLERARSSRRAFLEERATSDSLIQQERIKRMWDDVDARGHQAQNLLIRVSLEIEADSTAVLSKGQAGMRRTYVRWAAIAYMLCFIIAFPVWLFLTSRRQTKQRLDPASPTDGPTVTKATEAAPKPVAPPATPAPPALPSVGPADSRPSENSASTLFTGVVAVSPHRLVDEILHKKDGRAHSPLNPSQPPANDA